MGKIVDISFRKRKQMKENLKEFINNVCDIFAIPTSKTKNDKRFRNCG